jgi:hypothetical protein
MVFHVLNRGVARMHSFEKPADYQAFEQVLWYALDQSPMRICPFAVMPNRWRLLLLILFTISNGSESPEMAVRAG